MGVWGEGNFQNDTSADWLGQLTLDWIYEIREAVKNPECLEPDEFEGNTVPCMVEILAILHEKGFGASLPKPEEAHEWKRIFMEVWEDTIDDFEPEDDHKEKRRQVLNNTFDKLIKITQEQRRFE